MVIEWIENNMTLAFILSAGLFSAVGYFWHRRRERKENLRTALFFLAQIWHALSLAVMNLDRFAQRYLERVQGALPDVHVSPADEAAFREFIRFNMKQIISMNAAHHIANLNGSYEEAVRMVSKTHPILAYDLATASRTRESLSLLDAYISQAACTIEPRNSEDTQQLDRLQANFTNVTDKEMVKDLENHLSRLAFGSGLWTWFSMKLRIRRRRKRLRNGPPDAEIDRYIREVIVPALPDL